MEHELLKLVVETKRTSQSITLLFLPIALLLLIFQQVEIMGMSKSLTSIERNVGGYGDNQLSATYLDLTDENDELQISIDKLTQKVDSLKKMQHHEIILSDFKLTGKMKVEQEGNK